MTLLTGGALRAVAKVTVFATAGDSASSIWNILSAVGAHWVVLVVPERGKQAMAMLADGG